jgi:glycosyltransferase involved in cell wall biosynthesis
MSYSQRVSVIIPTYNHAHYIGRAINSVLNQTYRDFELIVVDDASTDQTQRILEQMNDKRIKIIRHENNKGAPAARNTGIKASEGEFIGFLDDDDEWLPKKLEKQLRVFQTSVNDVGLVYTGFYFASGKNGSLLSQITPTLKGSIYPDLLRRNIPAGNTSLIRKHCFARCGLYDETLPSCQDWDMWIRISKFYKFDFVSEALSNVYVHGRQISTNLNAKIVAREKLITKYHEDLVQNPAILAVLFRRLGVLCCIYGNSRKAIKCFAKSIRLMPIQKGCYVHVLLSFIAPSFYGQLLRKKHVSIFEGIELFY